MIFILIVGFFIYIAFYIVKNKIHVKWKTFLHKGFKKLDNKFGLIVFTREAGDWQDIFECFLLYTRKTWS